MIASHRAVLVAWWHLLLIDLTVFRAGFPGLHRLIRSLPVRHRQAAATDERVVACVNDAIDRAAVWYPRTVRCLHRSALATWLLRQKGIQAVTVIGIRKMPFYAHAWVEVDGRVVNDTPRVQILYPAIDRLAPAGETAK